MENKELTCDEIKQYYQGFLNQSLPASVKEAVIKHFVACRECHNDFLTWAAGNVTGQ